MSTGLRENLRQLAVSNQDNHRLVGELPTSQQNAGPYLSHHAEDKHETLLGQEEDIQDGAPQGGEEVDPTCSPTSVPSAPSAASIAIRASVRATQRSGRAVGLLEEALDSQKRAHQLAGSLFYHAQNDPYNLGDQRGMGNAEHLANMVSMERMNISLLQ